MFKTNAKVISKMLKEEKFWKQRKLKLTPTYLNQLSRTLKRAITITFSAFIRIIQKDCGYL